MREYRGLRIDGQGWVYGAVLESDDNTFIFSRLDDMIEGCDDGILAQLHLYPVIPETVGQYIGLNDVNDKKIYKGDQYQYQNGEIYTVYFRNGAFCGGLREDYCSPLGWVSEEADGEGDTPNLKEDYFHKEIEVIGSIHKERK